MTTLTAQELNRDVSVAKRATADGPVFITTRGTVTHVLLSIADFEEREASQSTLYAAVRPEWLGDEGVGVEPPARDELARWADL